MIPSGIQHHHFVAAARDIDANGVPPARESRDFDVYIHGRPYPPKYLISLAYRFAKGEEWPANRFITTEARSYLAGIGYDVRRKTDQPRNASERPKQDAILLTWQDAEARGYTDIFSLGFFTEDSPEGGVIHRVRGPKSGEFEARCQVILSGNAVDLNYEPFPSFNSPRGILLGVTRLSFSDADRTAISKVEWKPAGVDVFTECEFVSPSYELAPAPPYIPPSEPVTKVVRMVRERPGQSAFRKKLRAAYDNTCCITGCKVAEALEGAHIDPYCNEASDNPKNGLLLRRDVHALFDAYMISIDPKTRAIHVTEEVGSSPGYDYLRTGKLNSPNELSHEPDAGALQRHWSRFQAGKKEEVTDTS